MRVIQINSVINSGSTGRITESIGLTLLEAGYTPYVAFGRESPPSSLDTFRIGSKLDVYSSKLQALFFDNEGLRSYRATRKLLRWIKNLKPDVVGLHNLHGYYLNYELLFDFLREEQIPVVWTFHDCWPITGHCAYFDSVNCNKWQVQCGDCPLLNAYPRSLGFIDNSGRNFHAKRQSFTGLKNLLIITPSEWLKDIVQKSFLKEYSLHVINNGVDLEVFKPSENYDQSKNYVLGVASTWDRRKGLQDFLSLRKILDPSIDIVLIGLSQKQIKENQGEGLICLERTENLEELSQWYGGALYFINPTYIDNFPTTNLEALACGTPVITYKTGGSPESINSATGFVLDQGDIEGIRDIIINQTENIRKRYRLDCRSRAEEFYDKNDRFKDYLKLYQELVKKAKSENNLA